MPPVSLFIPAKNEVNCISDLLHDLKVQVYPNELEIVVYDAGSTDGTQEVVKSYGVEVRPGGEVNVARNLGISKAKHSLVIMLDADVRVGQNFVYEAVKEFVCRKVDIGTAWNIPFLEKHQGWTKLLLVHIGWFIGHVYQWIKQFSVTPRLTSTFVILNKDAWKKAGGFNEEVYRGGDTEFVLRAVACGLRFRFLNSVSVKVSARKALTIGTLKYFLITYRMNRVLVTEKLSRSRYEAVTGDRDYFENKKLTF